MKREFQFNCSGKRHNRLGFTRFADTSGDDTCAHVSIPSAAKSGHGGAALQGYSHKDASSCDRQFYLKARD